MSTIATTRGQSLISATNSQATGLPGANSSHGRFAAWAAAYATYVQNGATILAGTKVYVARARRDGLA